MLLAPNMNSSVRSPQNEKGSRLIWYFATNTRPCSWRHWNRLLGTKWLHWRSCFRDFQTVNLNKGDPKWSGKKIRQCLFWIRFLLIFIGPVILLRFPFLFSYLSSSLCPYQPSRSLRSSTEGLLKIPKTNLKTFGERSFGYIAPTVCNSLPADLRTSPSLPTFKANLKTYLFRQAFWFICTY